MGRGLVYVFTTVIPDLYLKFKSDELKICKINQFEPLLINLLSLIRPFTWKVNFTKYGYGRWYYNTHPFWNDTQQFYLRKLLHKDILSCGFNDVEKSEFSTCMPHPNFKRLVPKACDLSKSTKQMKKDGKVVNLSNWDKWASLKNCLG